MNRFFPDYWNKVKEYGPVFPIFWMGFLGFVVQQTVAFGSGDVPDTRSGFSFLALLLSIWIINSFTDVEEDFANDIGKLFFIQRQRSFYFFGVLSLVYFTGDKLLHGDLTWIQASLIATGMTYSYRLIPVYFPSQGFRWTRLKNILYLKNVIPALWWSIGAGLAPRMDGFSHPVGSILPWILSITLFLLVFSSAVMDDIMDVGGDRVAGTHTLPTRFGVRKTVVFLVSANLFALLMTGLLFYYHRLDSRSAGFSIANIVANLCLTGLNFRIRPSLSKWLFTAQLVLFSIFILAFTGVP